MRGTGRIFQRQGSAFLWCAYYLRGKEYRESTGETDANKAEKFLKRRLKEVGADQIGARAFVGPQQGRVKISELLESFGPQRLGLPHESTGRKAVGDAPDGKRRNRPRHIYGGSRPAVDRSSCVCEESAKDTAPCDRFGA